MSADGHFDRIPDVRNDQYRTGNQGIESENKMKKMTVAAKSGEAIRPLGFIGSDFVYGYLRQGDVGHTAAGGNCSRCMSWRSEIQKMK